VIDLGADREVRTRAKVTSVIRTFWSWAEEHDQVSFSPTTKLRTPRDRVVLLFLLDLGSDGASSRECARPILT
jgi:site-specific recombinase XerD